jgi:hypothetical protein
MYAGNGTGTGGSGYIDFQVAPAGSSGSTADTLASALRITNAGNVGIGLTPTTYKFEVTGGDVRTNTSSYLYANTLRLRGSDTYTIYESAATTNLQFGTNGAAAFIFTANGVGERMRITNNGGVSFGSTGTAYGTAGQALVSAGDAAPVWTTQNLSISFIVDGGGAVLTVGVKGDLTIPFNCTITEWTLLADQTGSMVLDIWKDSYANYPPTIADVITASAKPTISASNKGQSSTLTGWTTTITAGDTLRFNVNSCSTITRVTLSLKVYRT